MLGNSDGNENSSEAKGKKLADDDNLYQYVDSLPGQTQQLMQLHQVMYLPCEAGMPSFFKFIFQMATFACKYPANSNMLPLL